MYCHSFSGVGDAMGYFNGKFEFCYSGKDIHVAVEKLGGLENLEIERKVSFVTN